MAIEIKAPTFPESVADGTVATWHKQPGDAVKRDELLVDIETDKVVLDVDQQLVTLDRVTGLLVPGCHSAVSNRLGECRSLDFYCHCRSLNNCVVQRLKRRAHPAGVWPVLLREWKGSHPQGPPMPPVQRSPDTDC